MATKRRLNVASIPTGVPLKEKAYEIYGYRPGQEVPIGRCGKKYRHEAGRFTFQKVTLVNGVPDEVEVYGGPKGREMTRTFPIERLEPPKDKRPRKKAIV